MSFRDCLSSAVATGRVSEAKADEGIAAYDRAVSRLMADGLAESDAMLQASIERRTPLPA